MKNKYSLGIDFGTNSVRALILNLTEAKEVISFSQNYPSGDKGILVDKNNPHLARQHPGDYLSAMEKAVVKAVKDAGIKKEDIAGIGIDATGSTPLPVDKELTPLGVKDEFRSNLNAQAWLWKDHTSVKEASEITELAKQIKPQYLKKCGGAYSSEWFFSKIFNCYKNDRKVFDAAYSWIELSDYIPAVISGIKNVYEVKRNICAAGHKAMFNDEWGGLPDEEFLKRLAPEMADLNERLFNKAYRIDEIAGYLCDEWADKFGLQKEIPVAVGALDAHIGAIGSGVGKGVLVKIIGTSTCDIMVHPKNEKLKDIPRVAGIVNDSVLPEYIGIEAGQSAVGDIFNWFVEKVLHKDSDYHNILTEEASKLKAGQSGLLALDWNNGNRNILTDMNLTGLIVGQTLHTADYEIYRALVEATAFGALRIIEQMELYGITIAKLVMCGGISQKNPMVMQIYADVLNRPIEIAHSTETVALGAAIIGGSIALQETANIETIQNKVCKTKAEKFIPNTTEVRTYTELYKLYKKLHDSFGIKGTTLELYPVMKELLELKSRVQN